MFYRKLFLLFGFVFLFSALVQGQETEKSYLYHENGTVAFDSSFHTVYFNNKQAVFNPRFKKYNYKNGKIIYEPSYNNIYYSDGSIACNGRFKKVFYKNGNLAFDAKRNIVYDKNGDELLNFNEAPDKQYTINEEHLSITVMPKGDFEYKLELAEENFVYMTDFKTYFKIAKKNTNDNSTGEILRTLKLK
jgi:hypothetical protein